MRLSRWQALGNVYLVTPPLPEASPERIRELVGDADGILEVTRKGDDVAEVVVWNPDGSRAEISGNGTRIAAAWLAARTGAREVRIRTGGREVVVRFLPDGLAEQDMGDVVVGAPDDVDGIAFVPVDVGNPHAVVQGDPADISRIGPLLETHPRFPSRTNVQVARADGPHELTARVWERGAGETASSGTSAVAVAAALAGEGETVVHFPGGDLRVRIEGTKAFLTGPAEPVDPIRLRAADQADAEAIAAVFTPSFRSLTFLPELHTADEDRAFIRDVVLGAGSETWVAEVGGRIVGFLAFRDDELTHLYVHPDAQRRGVGDALLAKAKELRPAGFELWVFQENPARRFYEARGCRVVKLTDGSGNEERTPDALYAWRP
jgi:diaminopimelate epimerase